jgi:hypothetical protein
MLVAPGDPWASYARTIVRILRPCVGDLAVGSAPPGVVGEWPWPSLEPVHILTAWDPGGERPTDADNRRCQLALEAELRPRAGGMWVAEGVDPASGHREEGVAVRGISEADALALGARHSQDAIFAWTPLEWTIVACTGGRRVVSGWFVSEPET